MRRSSSARSPFFSILLVVVLVAAAGIWFQKTRTDQLRLSGFQVIRPPHEVHALAIQGDTLWAGGQDGVVGIRLSRGEVYTTLSCDQSLDTTRALLVADDGSLWIGHTSGLSRKRGEDCHTFTKADGLPDNRVNALYQDHAGRIWVGTWGGAAVLNANGWQVLTSADGLADDMVNVIFQDHLGGMWFGSAVSPRGGLTWCWQKRCRVYNIQNGLVHNQINTIFEDQKYNIWIGAGFYDRGGANRLAFEQEQWVIVQSLSQKEGLAGNKVRSIYEDQQGILWFGSESDGITRYDGSGFKILTTANGLADQEVKAIVQDSAGSLWLGGLDGMTRIQAQALEQLGQ